MFFYGFSFFFSQRHRSVTRLLSRPLDLARPTCRKTRAKSKFSSCLKSCARNPYTCTLYITGRARDGSDRAAKAGALANLGPGGGRVATTPVYLRLQIFYDLLMSSWYPSSSDFGANLAPIWAPSWAQNLPKIGPRALQHSSQIASYFL